MPGPASLTSSDADLLARAAGGDNAAFERFVERHEAWLFRNARALAGADAAEELLQDVFVAAWRGAASYGGGPDARPWLAAIGRNAWRRRFRHRVGEPVRHEPIEAVEAVEAVEASDGLALRAGWGAANPEAAFERTASRERIERGLQRLSADERELIVLRDLEGWSGEDAAAALGLSLSAQKSRLHRARLRLAAAVREQVHG